MPSCLESEALVTLGTVSADPEAALRHVLECDECRSSLRDVARLRAELSPEMGPEAGAFAVRAGFVDAVMAALPDDAARSAAHTAGEDRRDPVATRPSRLWWLVEGVLGAGAAVFVAAAAGSAAPGALGPSVLPLAGFVGLVAAARAILAPQA
jgi:hypothetical protein